MTLPAVDSWEFSPVLGPKYKVRPQCSNPSCKRWAEDAHHIVRRSQHRGKRFDWFEVEGKIYPNLCGLCSQCHNMITGRPGGHQAAIRLNLVEGLFYWCDIVSHPGGEITFLPYMPLDPHPPALDSLAPRASIESSEPEVCPTCGQAPARRRSVAPPGGARRRKTWAIKVPDDHEDGADVLDTLVDELAPYLHVEPSQTGRYFVVVPTLVYALQDIATFLESLRGVGA